MMSPASNNLGLIQKNYTMLASTLISNNIVPLRTSDTGKEALSIMDEFGISHMPIVNNQQLLGLLSEEDIISSGVDEAVGSYQLNLTHPQVREDDHIYEVMRLLGEYHLTVIPVVDLDGNYLGIITLEDLMQFFAKAGSFTEPGSLIVLEIAKRDYTLAEISRIVESENAAVLSSFVTTHLNNETVDVTVKINKQNIQSIIATFERYDYKIKGTFQESDYTDTLQERFDSLMNYLNV